MDGKRGTKPEMDGKRGTKPEMDGKRGTKPEIDGKRGSARRALTADTLADICSIRALSRGKSVAGMLGSDSLRDSPAGLHTRVCVFSMVKSALSETSKPSGVPMARVVAFDTERSALGFSILVCLMFKYRSHPVRT